MGARLLRKWITFPLKEKSVELRQNIVEEFLDNEIDLEYVHNSLKQIIDIERVISKIATEKISPRALNQLSNSLEIVEKIKIKIKEGKTKI